MNIEERIKEEFENKKYLHLKDILSKDLCYFFTSVLLLESRENNIKSDSQVSNAGAIMHREVMFHTLLELVWPKLEETLGEKLFPTYAYARLYKNGNILNEHVDRPACEVSLTIQLGRSHHYAWPIFMGKNRIDLAEGDAVLYKGCEIPHSRQECKGPDNYYTGNVFLHYVKANGIYKDHLLDMKENPESKKFRIIKNYSELMQVK